MELLTGGQTARRMGSESGLVAEGRAAGAVAASEASIL